MNAKNNYKLKITTLSPLHIGTGEVYEPTNFVIDDGYLYEFDEVLFLQSLSTLEKKSFEQKLGDYMQIIGFYKSHKNRAKQIAYHKTEISKKVQDVYNKIKNLDGTQSKNQLEIQKTYKNPNTHKAVIPGSSIKGMLDTVFQIYQQKIIENDIRQQLKLSDMFLLDGKTEIKYCYRRHKNPNRKARSPIPQIVEIVDKKAVFVGSMQTDFDFIDIKNRFAGYFNASSRKNSYFKATSDSFVARVGKFSGKAFMVDRGDNVLNSKFKPVATHTLDENNEPFGWIKIELISNKEFGDSIEKIESKNRQYFQDVENRQKGIRETIAEQKEKLRKEKEEKIQKEEAERKALQEAELQRQEALLKMSPVEKIIDGYGGDIAKIINAMKANEIENLEEIKEELAKILKEKMQKDPKQWEKAKQKALKRREYIEEILQ